MTDEEIANEQALQFENNCQDFERRTGKPREVMFRQMREMLPEFLHEEIREIQDHHSKRLARKR